MTPAVPNQTAPRESGRIRAVVARLQELLVQGEALEAIAVQRRIFALGHRRIVMGATSGRLMVMTRGLFGGFQVKDVRWQDLKDAQFRVGIIGAALGVSSVTSSDLAVAGQATATITIGGLRKNQAQRLYTICQAHEQEWREKRRIRELEELRAKSGGITLGSMPGAASTPGNDADPVARLERAREMLEKGLISDSEYEAIKARLVSSL